MREKLLKEYAMAAAFAQEHRDDDPDRLLLSAARWPGFDMKIVASTIESRRRLITKAPFWASVPGLVFPKSISSQQCSSDISSRHKALLASAFKPDVIADLTGGIGVDCLAMAQICKSCHYNEMDFELACAAEYNYRKISENNNNVNVGNINVTNFEASPDSQDFMNWLKNLSPDLIYLDPARRDSRGNKVFLLEDCSPNIVALQDKLLCSAETVICKLSPMADLSMVLSRLRNCALVQLVEYQGDCRELLVVQHRGYEGPCRIEAVNLDLGDDEVLECGPDDARIAPAIVPESGIVAGNFIFEPSKSLMKTGCYGLMSRILDAGCVGRDSHCFILTGERLEQLGNLPLLRSGRLSRILETAPLSGRSLKEFSVKYPCAETIARNVRFSSEDLRSRLRCRPSDKIRIFALGADSARDKKILIAAEIF